MLNLNHYTHDDEEESEDETKSLTDDVLDEIDDGILDEEVLDPLEAADKEDDEEDVDFDKHDDVDPI